MSFTSHKGKQHVSFRSTTELKNGRSNPKPLPYVNLGQFFLRSDNGFMLHCVLFPGIFIFHFMDICSFLDFDCTCICKLGCNQYSDLFRVIFWQIVVTDFSRHTASN